MTLGNKTLAGLIWTFISIVGTKFSTLIVGIILARLLEPEVFGLAAMLFVFLEIAQVFVKSGFAHALIREEVLSEEDKCTTFYSNLIASVIFYLILYFLAPAIARFYDQIELISLTRVMGLVLFAQAFTIVQSATLSNHLEFKKLSIAVTISNIVAGFIAVFMAYQGYGVWAIGYKYLFTAVIKSVIFWIMNPWYPRQFITASSFKKLFGFGSKLLVTEIIAKSFSNLYKVVIGKSFSAATLGYYTQGQQYILHLTEGAGTTIQKVTYPILSKKGADAKALSEAYRRIVLSSSYLVFPGVLGLVVLSEPLIITLVGVKWVPAVPYMQIIGIGAVVNHLVTLNQNVLKVKGRGDLFLRMESITRLVILFLIIVSIQFGIWGLLVAKVMGDFVSYFGSLYFIRRYIEYSVKSQLLDIGMTILHCIPMLLCLALVVYDGRFSPIAILVVSIIIGPIVYLGFTYFIKSNSLAHILRLLANRYPFFKAYAY